jgi:hypothetical protein
MLVLVIISSIPEDSLPGQKLVANKHCFFQQVLSTVWTCITMITAIVMQPLPGTA